MGRGDDGMKCIEVRTLLKKGDYADALDVVKTIHIDRIKSIVNLKAIASAYERAGEYAKAKEVLLRSYDIKPTKMTVYRLAYLSIKTKEFEDAEAYYQEFTEMAPDSPDRYILRYGIDRAKNVDYVLRIATLQKLKQIEYTEEWGYELAKIYHKAGLHEECIRECRDLIIWFGSGVIVDKAKLLCKYHEEGRESLDVYGVFEQNVTPEQVRERREQFHEDTADFGRQAEQVAKEEELRRQIDLDMEKTVDLRQIMEVEGDQFDLLKQEVHRVWGNPSEEHQALQQQREKAKKQVIGEPEMRPEPRPMSRQETEAMLAESLAKVMDKADKGELFSDPEMHEIVPEPKNEEYPALNIDVTIEDTRNWMDRGDSAAPSLQESNQEKTLQETSEEKQQSYVQQQDAVEIETEEVAIEEETAKDLEPIALDDEHLLVSENEPEKTLQESVGAGQEPMLESTAQPEEEEPKEEDAKADKKKPGKHARRKASRAAKRERARKAAKVAESLQLEGQEEKETSVLKTEHMAVRPEEIRKANQEQESYENVALEESQELVTEEAVVSETATDSQDAAKPMEQETKERKEQKTIEPSEESRTELVSEDEGMVASEEMLMAAVDEVMAEMEEEKEKAAAMEQTKEAKEPNFIDEYGMTLWEYFEKYQQDTRLCEDIYDALEKAMKGTRPLNFVITCKSKERYDELGRDIAKALKALGLKEKQQVGRIDAEKLNRMHLEKNYEKIQGGCILVEESRKITADTAQSIMNMINELSDQVVVILCDVRPYMKDLMDEYPMMKRYFPFDIAMK